MPANTPLNEPSPTIVVGDPTTDSRDPGTSAAHAVLSPAEQIIAERTERRRQRAASHKAPTRKARGLTPATESTNVPTPPRHMTLRDSVSIALIGVLVAGGVLGAILGALSVTGWVIGLLTAGLTILLTAVLRRYSRLT
jgi:hypothetical protein